MATAFRKDKLEEKISELGIYLDDNVDWSNERLTKRLGDYFIEHSTKKVPWGAKYAQSLETVQLCKHLKDELKNFKDVLNPLESDDYIAEFKANGFRCLLSYSPEEGFKLYSRKESVTNYLNGDFTDKVYFIKDGILRTPVDYINKLNYRFVLDGELTIDSADASFEGVKYESIEDFVQAILGSSAERAREFQREGHKIKFNVFDVLYFEKNPEKEPPEVKYDYTENTLTDEQAEWVEKFYSKYLHTADFVNARKKSKKLYSYLYSLRNTPKYDARKLPFEKRRKIRTALASFLREHGVPIEEVPYEDFYKVSFLDTLLREGCEGIVLKNLHAPYIAGLRSSRSHRANLKVKQSVSKIMEQSNVVGDFDVFITGANPPKSERIKDMIGSLSCSVYIVDTDGTTRVHEIANVSGLTHEWKREFAKVDTITGEITLNPKYLNKVIAVNGMALSGTNLKFHHAVLKDKNAIEFKAKNPTDCTWDIEALKDMVMVRGE